MDNLSVTAPGRAAALSLLKKYLKNESMFRHALAVEAVMAHFAGLFGEDREKWSVIGLVHDIDFELYPHAHCLKGTEILRDNNWPADYIRAVQSHGWKICTEIEPIHRMEKVLYAIDELTGLIAATVYMRPDRSIAGLEVGSVKKKWKQKNFAAGVNRQVIEDGAAMLGMDLDTLIRETISGMRQSARELGLAGGE